MRIGYFADGPWSHKAIEIIQQESQLELAFIVPRYDTRDPILKEWADKLSIPFLLFEDVNEDSAIDKLSSYTADIFVSMSFNQIIKDKLLKVPRLGFINCHAGALPFYRGRNPLNWALINGERYFGITVHYIDNGIDTGDIIRKELFEITNEDNYNSLLEKAINNCGEVLNKAILDIKKGEVKLQKQSDIDPIGSYFCMRKFGDEIIDFRWNAERCFNFIRAISSPGPNARCFFNNIEYGIISAKIIENAKSYIATCGEINGVTKEGNIIKVGDSSILLTSMINVNDGKIFTPKFKIGTRFALKSSNLG